MKINLISHDNGVGLTQDVRIVTDVLSRHDCKFWEVKNLECAKADINIHFEIIDTYFSKFAPVNLFFPNPEWFWFHKEMRWVDMVLAKTHDAVKLFEKFSKPIEFVSFTSDDRNKPDMERQRVYLHSAGKSQTKGTASVFSAWKPDYPPLVFTKLNNYRQYTVHPDNMFTSWQRLPFDTIVELQNRCYFHLCPSEYEGFGHYIWEAKSCGGIVITTDGAPMNEFVTEGVDGFLVPVSAKKKMHLATCKMINYRNLQMVIEKTMKLNDKDLEKMRAASRRSWEENDAFFRRRLNEVIDGI